MPHQVYATATHQHPRWWTMTRVASSHLVMPQATPPHTRNRRAAASYLCLCEEEEGRRCRAGRGIRCGMMPRCVRNKTVVFFFMMFTYKCVSPCTSQQPHMSMPSHQHHDHQHDHQHRTPPWTPVTKSLQSFLVDRNNLIMLAVMFWGLCVLYMQVRWRVCCVLGFVEYTQGTTKPPHPSSVDDIACGIQATHRCCACGWSGCLGIAERIGRVACTGCWVDCSKAMMAELHVQVAGLIAARR